MTSDEAIRKSIKDIELRIEEALWDAMDDENRERELERYTEARAALEDLECPSPDLERERARVLSYCLMRIDETLVNLGNTEDALVRAREALDMGKLSEDPVQIARCHLALGVRYLNNGQLEEADSHWHEVFKLAEGQEKNDDMQQVLGWTLLARAHVAKAKSLYDQALHLAKGAEGRLLQVDNYAGLAAVYELMKDLYGALGQPEKIEWAEKMSDHYKDLAKTKRR